MSSADLLTMEGEGGEPRKAPLLSLRGKSVGGIVERLEEATKWARDADDKAKRRRVYAALIFAYWAKVMGHDRVLFDEQREKRLTERLRENHDDVSELLYVVDGAKRDDFLMGRAVGTKKKYDEISTIFRDREQVERLAEACPKYRQRLEHPLAHKYLSNGNGNGTHP